MSQPHTGRSSFERETEFSLERLRTTQLEMNRHMESMKYSIEGLKAVVISCCFVTFFLGIAVLFSRC